MPQSRMLGSWPSYLAAMTPEIILNIMRLSGPADLTAIGSVCALFYSIFKQKPSCWAYARERLAIPWPPSGVINWTSRESPIPISLAQDHGSAERDLIAYLFRGGNCTVCAARTFDLPYSFALNWRFCSSTCRQRIFSIYRGKLVGIDLEDISKTPGAHWRLSHETGS
ncbi:hypothetical protein B0H17DRAFT_1213294 [Mycena rosella]|uniref:F-box domain-containing protein n=1 Tax=Mycena rosella TaxID=1033263 RepID=A0AAD7G221_MYCRO|nr:hypothetical protein B0H17DRAFT_1213294 [Mycena rosella]